MSVDLRQLIRQSSHITVNPKKFCTNAALINAHLYIITVTCGTSVVGGLGRVRCQERMGALCPRAGGDEPCGTGSFAVPQQALLCGSLSKEAALRGSYLHTKLMVIK